jgi:hypothetical protein
MSNEIDLQHLPLDDLAQKCTQETKRFHQRQPYDPRYCFELFQRAFVNKNGAWDAVFAQYKTQLAGWVRKHPGFESTGEEVQYFVVGAFGKFWDAMMPDKFRGFPDLGHLLRYLQMCVHSVITDFNRARDLADSFDPMEAPEPEKRSERRKIETDVFKGIRWQKCREWLESRLNDEKERLVIKLYIDDALKPREIYALFPRFFKDVDEVYKIRQNVVARLGRDPEFDLFCGEND